jgi:hypothetical protein
MDAELGPRRVDASARRMLGDPDHAYGVLVVFAEACLALALVLVLWYT